MVNSDNCAFDARTDGLYQQPESELIFGYGCFNSRVIEIKKQPIIWAQNSSIVSQTEEIYRAEIAAKQAIIDQLTAKLDAVRSALEN
jgi:hypothetical protein